jgi:hypothetical protein
VISLHLNPQGMEDEFLKCLNLCFGDWGDRRTYQWYFQRKTAYPDADLMVLKKDGELAAGSAVTYRKITLPNEAVVTVGIMTGSWTLPKFRGQGCFARIIEESVRLTAKKNGALVLGFGRTENSSFRQFAKAGAALFPTTYLFSTPETKLQAASSKLKREESSEPVIKKLFEKLSASGMGYLRFAYSSVQEFSAQFIHRPGETEILSDHYGNFGIVEKKEDTNLLQLFLPATDDESGITSALAAFLNHSMENGRKLFLYSTRSDIAQVGRNLGLGVKAGFLPALIAGESSLRKALGISEPSTTKDSFRLATPGTPLYLNPWSIHSGDRA